MKLKKMVYFGIIVMILLTILSIIFSIIFNDLQPFAVILTLITITICITSGNIRIYAEDGGIDNNSDCIECGSLMKLLDSEHYQCSNDKCRLIMELDGFVKQESKIALGKPKCPHGTAIRKNFFCIECILDSYQKENKGEEEN